MSLTKEQIEQYLDSPEAEAVMTLIAYGILKTPTTKDDEVLADVSEYSDLVAEKLKTIADQKPTTHDAEVAGLVILKDIAAATKTKIDDFIVALAEKAVG